ncbi:hypothetical protein cypCar_00048363 [Cyprinus carpio]|nr:hypothetical protein cypCar_00048363 [Cyprinus carpio]
MLQCPDQYIHKSKVRGTNAKMQYRPVLFLLLPALSETVHGHYGYVQMLCHASISQNFEFTFSVNYNKFEYLRYNSTEKKVVGYTEFGEKWAEDYNMILLAKGDLPVQQCRQLRMLTDPFAALTGKIILLAIDAIYNT